MIAGQERIGVSDTSQLTPSVQKEAEDFLGFEGPVRVWYPMEADDVLIVAPEGCPGRGRGPDNGLGGRASRKSWCDSPFRHSIP